MLRTVLISLLLFTLPGTASSATPAAEPGHGLKEFRAQLAAAVKSGTIPGSIAVAGNRDGLLSITAAGPLAVHGNTPVTPDSLFRIASMTKPVTSVAVLQLVEQGKLGLDEPLQSYLPRFADARVLEGFDEAGQPMLRAARSPVTIRQLLSHTSGYVYALFDANAARLEKEGHAVSMFVPGDGFLDVPLAFDPGTRWAYGINTNILGHLVEVVSGQRLDAWLTRQIFAPLGMHDTHFMLPADKQSRLATPYTRGPDSQLAEFTLPPDNDAFFSGGGGLYSTPVDYMRFLRALLRGGELDGVRILSPAMVEEMARNQTGSLPGVGELRSTMSDFSNSLDMGWDDRFGLGFLISSKPGPHGRAAGSLSWAGLFNTYFWIDPASDVAAVFMTQLLPFGDPQVLQLLAGFEQAVYGHATTAGTP